MKIADLSGLEAIIPNIAAWFNIEPATALLLLAIVSTACNIVSRSIPDTETGVLGVVRNITRIIGLYVPNRVAPRTSVQDVAVDAVITAVEHKVPPQVRDYFDSVAKQREEEAETSREG